MRQSKTLVCVSLLAGVIAFAGCSSSSDSGRRNSASTDSIQSETAPSAPSRTSGGSGGGEDGGGAGGGAGGGSGGGDGGGGGGGN